MNGYYKHTPGIVIPPWVHALVECGILEDNTDTGDAQARFVAEDGTYLLLVDYFYARDREFRFDKRFAIMPCVAGACDGHLAYLMTDNESEVMRWMLKRLPEDEQ